MKKGFLLLVLSLLAANSSFAQYGLSEEEDTTMVGVPEEPAGTMINGLEYVLKTYDNRYWAFIRRNNCWEGELAIPSRIEHNGIKYTVSEMSDRAFESCQSLTKVILPKTISSIISRWYDEVYVTPFMGCSVLESIEVDEDNSSYCSIDGVMFTKDKKSLICYPAGSKQRHYTVPDDVRMIYQDAFSHSPYLVSVTLPSHNVTMYSSFKGCTALESVTLPQEMTFIPGALFMGCTSLKNIDIPAYVMGTGSNAFEGCSSLTTVELPPLLTKIGAAAFKDCSSLHTLVIRAKLPTKNITNGWWLEYLDPEKVTIYAQPTQVELIKERYSGTVLPLDQYHPEGDPNAIQAVKAEKPASESVHDLQGRRVNSIAPRRGVYVKNGKKIIDN